ncbi:MAG: LptA/OstA family protein [Verrucomicrobiota bacterium]
MKRHLIYLNLILTLTWQHACLAQNENAETTISSESFTLNLEEKQGVFAGKVVVSHPKFELFTEEMVVYFTVDNKVERMLAKGQVRIKQADKSSESREAEYLVGEKKIILTGNPVVTQGENIVSGNTINIYPETDKMEVTGRSKLQFYLE